MRILDKFHFLASIVNHDTRDIYEHRFFYLSTILKASKGFWFWWLLSFCFTKWTGWSELSWTSIAGKWCELPLHSAQQCLCHDSIKTKLQCCQSPALPPPCCRGLLYSNKPLYSNFLSHIWYLGLGLCLWAVWIQYAEPENLINSGLWLSSVLGSKPLQHITWFWASASAPPWSYDVSFVVLAALLFWVWSKSL